MNNPTLKDIAQVFSANLDNKVPHIYMNGTYGYKISIQNDDLSTLVLSGYTYTKKQDIDEDDPVENGKHRIMLITKDDRFVKHYDVDVSKPNWDEEIKIGIDYVLGVKFKLLLKQLRLIPMIEFDPFLKSLEQGILNFGNLTPKQLGALEKVKKKYSPQVSLSKDQLNFLDKLANLPANKMSTQEKEVIARVYSKACQGTPWTEDDKSKVSFILKKY